MGMRISKELEQQILATTGVKATHATPPPRPLLKAMRAGGLRDDEQDRLTEKEFDAALVKRAKELGWETYHTHDSRRSRAGWPDRAFWRDRFFLAELKAENGRLEPEQEETIAGLRRAGVTVYVWRPSDWPQIEAVLA